MWSVLVVITLAVFDLQVADARPTKTTRDAKPWGDDFSDGGSASISSLSQLASSLLDSCSSYDLSQVQLPTAPTPLPHPKGTLAHIAIGRGTQNYTCDLSNSTAVPVPVGALATLYNVSCVAANTPSLFAYLPNLAYSTRLPTLPDITSEGSSSAPSSSSSSMTSSLLQTLISQFQASTPENFVVNIGDALMSGHHFFTDDSSPRFDLDTNNGKLGCVTVEKVSESDAPSDATENSVPWLYLPKSSSYTATPQDFSEVYRVNTVGGAAPATCNGVKHESFVRQYAAEYWFFK